MAISAKLVKELRERTGSGLMECKRALQDTDGDIEAAIDAMRKSGLAKASKKADRIAAEGVILIRQTDDGKKGVMVEINCETDFVTKSEDFQHFADHVVEQTLTESPSDLAALLALPLKNGIDVSIEQARQELIAKIGENINVRRFAAIDTAGTLAGYLHSGRIGVMVELDGGEIDLAKDVAMHVAATNPQAISEKDVSADLMDKEKEVFSAQARESGKPEEIIEKMVAGRLKKYLAEITLLGQAFVKNPDTTVGELVGAASVTVNSFQRFEVGEGIEKKEENFAEEVMAQAKGD